METDSTEKSRISEEHCILQAKVSLWYFELELLVTWFENFDFFSVPEPKASFCIQPGGENKILMRNDSERSNTSAKDYYLNQSRYLPGKVTSQCIWKIPAVHNLHTVLLGFRFLTG